MTHGHFESTFSKYPFGRGSQKRVRTLCTLVKMMTIMDDPLNAMAQIGIKRNTLIMFIDYIKTYVFQTKVLKKRLMKKCV